MIVMAENQAVSEPTIDRFKLIRLRHLRGLTQGQLSVKSGIAQAHLSRIESGIRKSVKVSTLQRLASALGVSPEDLLPGPLVQGQASADELEGVDLSDPSVRVALRQLAELSPVNRAVALDLLRVVWERQREGMRREGGHPAED